ncbi:DUF6091 family protein [Marinobacteraceae bacterium S3BR75-40.1]
MNRASTALLAIVLLGLILPLMPSAQASGQSAIDRKLCLWDPVGRNGPVYNNAKSLKLESLNWGVNLHLEAYTDEQVASNDFLTGHCDAVITTELLARRFNKFTGSLGAVGALRNMDQFQMVVDTLTQPKAQPLMRSGEYEVGGVFPIGSVFMYVDDRSIRKIEDFQGQKMAVLNADPIATNMVRRVGGSAVNASLTTLSGLFNNGNVDIIFAPAVAFETLELYRGLKPDGGIINYPLLLTSLQLVIRHERFPENFGQKLREFNAAHLDSMKKRVHDAEASIPDEYWIEMDPEARQSNDLFLRESRIDLLDQGLYDPRALRLMKAIRCKQNPTAAECADSRE